jgi:Dolichyl-phosphate-mannose-protein mannosyltransferase
LEAANTVSNARTDPYRDREPLPVISRSIPDRRQYTIYGLLLAVSISIWFIAIRAPLWLDETVSIYLIQGGLTGMMSRHVWPDSPTYSFLLWLWTKAFGMGEITLRVSALLPMFAAVYLLYLAARQLFDRDVALIAAIVFCLHPIIIFAAIDIRPYAFAALAINSCILALVHLRHNNSNWLAALFGLSAACIVQFQLLFAVILPALALCFVVLKLRDRKVMWRQLGVAAIVFAVASLPVIPRLQYMAHTSGTHVFSEAPTLLELASTLTLRGLAALFILAVLAAAARHRLDLRTHLAGWPILLCTSLALIPILALYALSVGTSIHVFVPRYRLVAVPGISLCWAMVAGRIRSRGLRLLVCLALVAATAIIHLTTPLLRQHQYSWKYALEFVEKNASVDQAPVLICSDIPEADHMAMPVGPEIQASGIVPPLSYYKLSVPVAVLPRALNDEARQDGSRFLQQSAQHRRRFLAMAFAQSYATLDWLTRTAEANYDVRQLGEFDGVRVVEFKPRDLASANPSSRIAHPVATFPRKRIRRRSLGGQV